MSKKNKPETTPFIPILLNFDQLSNPVGYVDLTDERCVLKLNPKQKVTVADIQSGAVALAPSYIISKEKDGIVLEAVLDSFSLITRKAE